RGAGDLAAHRRDRHEDPGPAPQLAGPRARGVHHRAARDLLARQPYGIDPSVRATHDPCDLLAEPDPRATPARGVEIPVQDVERPEEPVRRTERAPDHAGGTYRRVQPRDLPRLDHAR